MEVEDSSGDQCKELKGNDINVGRSTIHQYQYTGVCRVFIPRYYLLIRAYVMPSGYLNCYNNAFLLYILYPTTPTFQKSTQISSEEDCVVFTV